jgi:molybdopterin-guanine dinucleotide biosynthesis protein A
LIHFICSKSGEADATVPIWKGEIQPLCGVYSKKCLTTINDLSLFNDPRKGIRYLLRNVKTRTIKEQEFPSCDQRELTFFDVDTQEQFQQALELMDRVTEQSRQRFKSSKREVSHAR